MKHRFVIKTILIITIVSLMLSVLAACAGKNAASDGDAAMPEKLTIVLMPNENNPDADTKNEEFRADLEEATGIPVEVFEGADYAVGITALAEGNIDVMLVSPMSYYQATLQAGVEPLVTYTNDPNVKPYKTVFITQPDNDAVNSLEDLEGKTFAFVDNASSSGYLYPKYHLVTELELESSRLEEAGYYFDSVAFSGSHQNSIIGVINGDYDAAAVGYGVLDYIPNLVEGKTAEDVKIIAETDVIPNPLYIIRADLPDDLKKQIKDFFLGYDNDAYFESVHGSKDIRFTETDDKALQAAQDLVKTLGIEAD